MHLSSSFISTIFLLIAFISSAQEYSTVYFYRSDSFVGSAVTYTIYDDTIKVGKMEPGRVLMYYAKPGNRVFTAKMENTSTAIILAEAGKSYFVECGVTMGAIVGNPTLRQTAPQRAISLIAKINPALKIDARTAAQFAIDDNLVKNDTIRALANLFERKRKGGNARGIVFLIFSIGALSTTDAEAIPAVAIFGTISITGFAQAGKYNGEKLDKVVKDYQDGQPIPDKIKSKFKEKDFR